MKITEIIYLLDNRLHIAGKQLKSYIYLLTFIYYNGPYLEKKKH